jgi:hypothetical protein
VGDIEIVIEPVVLSALLNRLDVLLEMGVIKQAPYGKLNSVRWGEKLRGCLYQDVKVEVFICDEHNRGYLLWLRTGDGNKNAYVMQRLKHCHAPVRFHEGYGWHVSYDSKHSYFDQILGYAKLGKLIIPDEFTMYYLLGMQPIPAKRRNEKTYRTHLGHWVDCPSAEELREISIPKLTQKRLF